MKGFSLFGKGKTSEISLFYNFSLLSKLSSECLIVCKLWSYEISQDETKTENPENLKQMDLNAGDFFCTYYEGAEKPKRRQ